MSVEAQFVRNIISTMFCHTDKVDDTRSRTILNAIKDHYTNEALFDVNIVCQGGEVVQAHRLILSGVSGFFQTYFSTTGSFPHTLDAARPVSTLELAHCQAEDLRVILGWLYTGSPPDQEVLADKIFDIFIITDFLLMDVLKTECHNFLRKEVRTMAPLDSEYVMDAYKLGKLLTDPEIILIAQKEFRKMRSFPADFLSVDIETMTRYLRKIDKCSLDDVWRANLIIKEMFFAQLVASYINYDKKNRLEKATGLFSMLKLVLIADILDFKELNLEELDDPDKFPELHYLLNECRIFDDVNLSGLPPYYRDKWLPRKESIKYSFWTGNRGNFLTIQSAKNRKKKIEYIKGLRSQFGRNPSELFLLDALEKGSQELAIKKFSLENKSAYLVGIDIFTSSTGVDHAVVDGIRLHWSDNTSQHAGSLEGICNSVTFYPPRMASVAISIASKMFLTAIKITTWTTTGGKIREGLEFYGPYGKPSGPMREAFTSNKLLETKAYLDGIRGYEVKVGSRKILSGLSFKMSFFVNYPLTQITGKEINAEPPNIFREDDSKGYLFAPTTLKILQEPVHLLKVHEFRRVARAAIKMTEWHYPFCGDPNAAKSKCSECFCPF